MSDNKNEAMLERIPQSLEELTDGILDEAGFVSEHGTLLKVDGAAIAACLRYVARNRPAECVSVLQTIADALEGNAGAITLRPVRAKRGAPVPRDQRHIIRERNGRIAWHVWDQFRQFSNMDSAVLSASETFKKSESVVWTALHSEADDMDAFDSVVAEMWAVEGGGYEMRLHDISLLVERFGVISIPNNFMRTVREPSFKAEFGEFRNWLKSYSTAPTPQ